MKHPCKERGSFTIPADFRLEDYIDPEWGIYSRREKYDFILQFSPSAAALIGEKSWHRDQETKEMEDGSVILKFSSGQIETIGQWVISWGDQVLVKSPPGLIERVRETCRRVGEMYG